MTSARFGALWLVAAGLISGLAVIAFGHVRWGGLMVAGVMFGAALIRLALPSGRAGGLVVRSRLADVLFLLGMAAALFVIVIALDLNPRG
ncbi:MAG TPA: DUF3017 domain-containing protein [Dermatophilaceae bacterium]|nr:DUF3017 domain-containing protein [Dermatophilaceae bacterium]